MVRNTGLMGGRMALMQHQLDEITRLKADIKSYNELIRRMNLQAKGMKDIRARVLYKMRIADIRSHKCEMQARINIIKGISKWTMTGGQD